MSAEGYGISDVERSAAGSGVSDIERPAEGSGVSDVERSAEGGNRTSVEGHCMASATVFRELCMWNETGVECI